MQFIKDTHINFIGYRKVALTISIALILIGIGSIIFHGGPNYSIDFTGGTSLQIRFEKPIDVKDVRATLSDIGLGSTEIKEFARDNELLIRLQQQDGQDISDKVIAELKSKLSDNEFEIRLKESVGPKVGSELRKAGILAVLFSLLLILIYISWRFEFKFAVGAVVALFHDVMITLGVFSLLDIEFSLAVLGAFLTIIGYSLNDTIVVFDRIRENLKVLRKEEYVSIFNRSINQTLSRTILTSLTTFVVVIILFFFGGEVIHNFSLALVIGVIVGTYSSIFIASPVVVEWYLRGEKNKRK